MLCGSRRRRGFSRFATTVAFSGYAGHTSGSPIYCREWLYPPYQVTAASPCTSTGQGRPVFAVLYVRTQPSRRTKDRGDVFSASTHWHRGRTSARLERARRLISPSIRFNRCDLTKLAIAPVVLRAAASAFLLMRFMVNPSPTAKPSTAMSPSDAVRAVCYGFATACLQSCLLQCPCIRR